MVMAIRTGNNARGVIHRFLNSRLLASGVASPLSNTCTGYVEKSGLQKSFISRNEEDDTKMLTVQKEYCSRFVPSETWSSIVQDRIGNHVKSL